ncbi:MAG TPA: bifunctional precorrin-2 dehydrogenase/sirohydrochlorin ferrochelatase [Symbiobacteriaceae bacterium]
MARYYPIALDLTGRRCLVVGGGHEALAKTRGLLEAGARVHAISPTFLPEFDGLAEPDRLTLSRRRYRAEDLQGVALAFGCAEDEETHRALVEDARRLGVLLNVVDQPHRCDFILPAVLRQGSLTVAITTDGKSPALASWLREQLSARLGSEVGEFLDVLGALRPVVKASVPDRSRRATLFSRLVRSRALERLQAGDRDGMYAELSAILKEYDVPCPREWSTWSAPDPGPRT